MRKPKIKKESREAELLQTAARLFKEKGFDETSMRDIAGEVGMLPGSMYYHFPSKDDLLIAVYRIGINNLLERASKALEGVSDPWERLRAVCEVHLHAILDADDFAAVAVRVLPRSNPALLDQLTAMRDRHEDMFRQMVAELPLRSNVNRKFLRLGILGAMNYSLTWYRAGADDPSTIVEKILRRFIEGEEAA